MVTDKQSSRLAEQVYWIDGGKNNVDYRPREGKKYYFDKGNQSLGQFKVLKVEDNPTNGMQAMAIVPIVNGKEDYSNITIAYAGTNFGDGKDRKTDWNSIIWGQNYYTTTVSVAGAPVSVPTQSQIDTALAFAAQIQAEHPQANISTTGHSLGGYLGLLVAIKNRWDATVFNAPSPHNMLDEDDIKWAKAHIARLVNYRKP